MIKVYVYFIMMFLSSIFMFLISMIMVYLNNSIICEWLLMSVSSINIEIIILIDWISVLFISFIFLISSMILMYSSGYMQSFSIIDRFIYLVILFIFSMVLMIISPNIISILFGWDGLGLVSYCLIIFYQNYLSFNSGMVTVMCNRVGDIGILMGVALMMMKGSWNIWFLSSSNMLMFMLFLASISKSAQIPFSSWLPMAMAAPTPVSALVHSSTLVTAGVYLMIRFNSFLMSSLLSKNLFFLSVLTMFMAGLMANFENDLKKIIALSTLSQLGMMMVILSVGMNLIAFYHLLIHAIFKSMLFMCAGAIIHVMMNNQDIRLFGNLNEVMPFTMMSFMIANVALCGMPFMSGFYSKDLIMELIYCFKVNIFMLFMIVVSLIFTVMYSVRVFYYLFFNEMKFYSYYNFKEESVMNISMMILIFMSIIMGSLLGWMFFFDFYFVYLNMKVKLLTMLLCISGGVISVFMLMMSRYIYKFYYLKFFLSSMWFLNYMYVWIYKPVNFFGVSLYMTDKVWMEYLLKYVMLNLFKYFNKMFSYSIYMFMSIFIIVLMFLMIMI